MKQRKTSILLLAGIAIVAVVWLVSAGDGRLVIEKMMTSLAMPYGMAWLAASVMLTLALIRKDRWFITASLIVWSLLYFGGNGYLARVLLRGLEAPYIASTNEPASFQAIVVLGGGTSVRPDGSVQVGNGGDRVVTAARLYHTGRADKVYVTGSRIPAIDRFGLGQGEIAEQVLIGLGVDAADIERVAGRTTAEEMKFLADKFEDDSQVGLITSAWHLPRAVRLAKSHGFEPHPIPSDFRSPPDLRPSVGDLLPSAQAAEAISRVAKEWLAAVVGR